MPTPEEKARQKIDEMLVNAGWVIQDYKQAQIHACQGEALFLGFNYSSGFAIDVEQIIRKAVTAGEGEVS